MTGNTKVGLKSPAADTTPHFFPTYFLTNASMENASTQDHCARFKPFCAGLDVRFLAFVSGA
jgi:hypothetical protein